MDIQWYPGHMTKARREMQANLKLVDLIVELVDARAPYASRNPDIRAMANGKADLIVLNKADLADPALNEKWLAHYRREQAQAMTADSRSASFRKKMLTLMRDACSEKLERDRRKGIRNSTIRAMITGIPNVGKSTLINSLAGRASAKTGNKPGVTRGQQWIHLQGGIDLLDTPGILWPRFDDPNAGRRLAWIGSIRDEILPGEELALSLAGELAGSYPGALSGRYGIEEDASETELLRRIALSRGCVRGGGEADTEKAAHMLLDEFRRGLLGRITLEGPDGE